ncbi:MAG: hypothetical protein E7299_06155 [Lachnospiraceae bacterium]|nr:hypothetical protein [Lachnospiraceae bacterium]
MKKRYLYLVVVWLAACLLIGCSYNRLTEVKHSSEADVENDMDTAREEIPEKQEEADTEEKRPSEVLEDLLSQMEEAKKEMEKTEVISEEDVPEEVEEENADENSDENVEETEKKDDFSDIDLDTYAYSSNREEFPSDVAFANFRSLSGGAINGNMFYRSSSPVCNVYNRAPFSDAFAEAAGIKCVLNLSDSSDEVRQFMAESGYVSPYYKSLFESGKVLTLNMGTKYYSNKYAFALADGLKKMLTMEGPVLIHCIEGKNRTGFVSMLFEGLAGATYQEIVDDYMATFYNYYPGMLETDDRLYECFKKEEIDEKIRYISGCDKDADLTGLDMHQYCRQYLYNAGLTEAELDLLEARLKSS